MRKENWKENKKGMNLEKKARKKKKKQKEEFRVEKEKGRRGTVLTKISTTQQVKASHILFDFDDELESGENSENRGDKESENVVEEKKLVSQTSNSNLKRKRAEESEEEESEQQNKKAKQSKQ